MTSNQNQCSTPNASEAQAAVRRKTHPRSHKITSLYYDEKSHCLLLGYLEGEVELFVASTTQA